MPPFTWWGWELKEIEDVVLDPNDEKNYEWVSKTSIVTQEETLPTVTGLPLKGKYEYIRDYLREKRGLIAAEGRGNP